MFPDFPDVQAAANRFIQAAIERQMGAESPMLRLTRSFVQHEGKQWLLRRSDGSESHSGFRAMEASAQISKKDLRSFDMQAIVRFIEDMAEQLARQQSELMLTRLSEATEKTGNLIDARGELTREIFLELLRKKQTDFDPETLQPSGEVFIIHPDTFEKIEPRLREWENDPDFRAEYDAIMDEKRGEWREREANRELVD